jgi:hypothetical protein
MSFRKRPHRKRWQWYFPGIVVLAVLAAFFNPAKREIKELTVATSRPKQVAISFSL